MDGLEKNEWLSSGCIPGYINTSDGLTKSLPNVNLRNLLDGDMFQIVTDERVNAIRRKYRLLNTILAIMAQFRGKGFEH